MPGSTGVEGRDGPGAPDGPRRTCVGCRRRARPDELVRVVRTPDGGLARGRSRPGRGAWVCPDPACAVQAGRRRAWSRALRGPVSEEAAADLASALGERSRGEESSS